MVDYAVDGSFDLYFSDLNDFETIEGKEEFHQRVIIDIHYKLAELTGSTKGMKNIREKIQLQVSRTAAKFEQIDDIKNVIITELSNASDTVSVEIVYDAGDSFQETI